MSGSAPAQGGPWYPPIPSLAALPVDRSKTEPKPAYYKLQFGDDVTGFSYYVRTLAVIIGRNCERAVPVPPPGITSPSVPPIPPLESLNSTPSPAASPQPNLPSTAQQRPQSNSSLSSPHSPTSPRPTDQGFRSVVVRTPSVEQDYTVPLQGVGPIMESPPSRVKEESLIREGAQPAPEEDDAKPELELVGRGAPEVQPEVDARSSSADLQDLGVPPPPPSKPSGDLDHVDVDLGPLKSVSRNHARIEYRSDLGRFCLEIYGRNGAWVDDRYYVRGSVVPLYQGSRVQIATRIFSFILPPSRMSSPTYTHYALDGTPHDAENALEDLPYPYNLPPTKVGYQEFYGEPGPGPTTMAGQVPQVFSAFAAADGHGLGIETVHEEIWVHDWDSEEGSDEDFWGDSSEEECGDGAGEEDESRSTTLNEESELSSLSEDDEGEDDEEEAEEAVQEETPGTGRKANNRRQAAARRTADVKAEVNEEPPGKGGRSGVKRKTARTSTTVRRRKGGKPVDEPINEDQYAPTPNGDRKSMLKREKAVEDTSTAESEKPIRKKGSKKATKSTATKAEAAAASVQTQAVAATLAAAMEIVPSPSVAPKPQQVTKQSAPPTGRISAANPQAIPQAQGQVTRALPAQVTRQDPRIGSLPSHPVIQLSAQARSIVSPSPTGSAEPQKPFFLTELVETLDRPGHLVVDVPIPPSGAGPRPPPGPAIGLDGNPFIGPPAIKPTGTFASIIHKALVNLPRGRGTLGEVCNWVAGEWEWFRFNVDVGWQNSIRHNLSLNKAFLKVPRIPEDDPESKGSVWIIDPEEGPAFEEKQRRDTAKSGDKAKDVQQRREQRQRAGERPTGSQMPTKPPPPQRQMAVPARAAPRLTAPPVSTAPQIVSANANGVLLPKARIIVVIQPITPAMRANSVISTSDASGNILPFVCDGTTLVLEQQTFGHLTNDITDKLTLLGAAGAVDVLSAWVINKNKQQLAKAAQASTAVTVKPLVSALPARTVPKSNNALRPDNGTSPNPPPKALQPSKPSAPNGQSVSNPTPGPRAAPAKTQPGAAPPGTTLTKVIGMIAEVANAKGDVNIVGPNASALLKYIRVVGVDIDLRVAERIWATGVIPPLPIKKGVIRSNGVPPVSGHGVKRKLEGEMGSASPVPAAQVGTTGIESEAKKPRLQASSA